MVICQWPEYCNERQHRADSLRCLYLTESRQQPWCDICQQLVDVYDEYQNDSALYYIEKLYTTALWMPDSCLVNACRIRFAQLLTKGGMYTSAFSMMAQVDTLMLDAKGLTDYFRTREFIYEELAGYEYLWFKHDEYVELERQARQRLITLLPVGSAERLRHESYDLLMQRRYDEAYDKALECLAQTSAGGRIFDRITQDLRFICIERGDLTEAKSWLAQSAISEIRQGIRNQVGLWTLASLMEDEDLDRAYRYTRFSWKVISQSGHRLMTQHLLPVMGTLSHSHDAKVESLTHRLQAGIILLCLLLLALGGVLYYVNRQRRRLALARKNLRDANLELRSANVRLNDANRVKEQYLISFFRICSDYIDQMESLRVEGSKQLRLGKEKELLKKLSSPNFTQQELSALHAHFDEVFLGLYPTFIDDFNALLQEEARIRIAHRSRMNTPLRIFALLRIGIERPADVAAFLHCSPVTVYNYRAQFRSAYLGSRGAFEEAVKSIGLQPRQGS